MEFKTKYNIGDVVYFMYDQTPCKEQVISVDVRFGEYLTKEGKLHSFTSPIITYGFENTVHKVVESATFKSKQELIDYVIDYVFENIE